MSRGGKMFRMIPPREIASRVMSLIDDASREVIVVSPFNWIDRWDKMRNCIEDALARRVRFRWYVRDDAPDGGDDLFDLGIDPIAVPYLHAKLYMNETWAVVTSMNMTWVSDERSIDIGHEIRDPKALADLRRFVDKHIAPRALTEEGPMEPDVTVAPPAAKYQKELPDWSPVRPFLDAVERALRGVQGTKVRRGDSFVELTPFLHQDLRLTVECRKYYLRLDFTLAPEGEYRHSKDLFARLRDQVSDIESALGHPVNLGPQMRRLKFDLDKYPLADAERWRVGAVDDVVRFALAAGRDLARRLT